MNYLHGRIELACQCCGVVKEFVLKSNSDHILCDPCKKHQGSSPVAANKRNDSHIEIWRGELEYERTFFHGEIDRRDVKIAQLTQEIADRPVRVVERNLDQEQVNEAKQKMEAAYRSRDLAFAALMEIRLIHREEEGGKCRCGRSLGKCKEFAVVGQSSALSTWEKKQVELLRQNRRHYLPDNHPAVSSRGWVDWRSYS